jgi:molybdenum cofactor cytidylyltransferase
MILLAAGRSSRMGAPKGLLPFGGRPWLLEQLSGFRKAGGREAIVVLGFHREAYEERIPWLKDALTRPLWEEGLKIAVVVNPAPEQGPFSSLLCALAAMGPRKRPAYFVLPLDVPCPGREVWEKLAQAFNPPLSAIIPRFQNRGGHPVLLSAVFLDRLNEIPATDPNARLDFQIRALPLEDIAYVDVQDPRIGLNLNTPEAFARFIQGAFPF